MLIGNVGKEPDVRYYDTDQAVAQFPLATTERGYTLQNGTKVPDHTDWHNLVVWRGLAKVVDSMLKGVFVTAAMTIKKDSDAMLLKSLLRTWNYSIPNPWKERRMLYKMLRNQQPLSLSPHNKLQKSRTHRQ